MTLVTRRAHRCLTIFRASLTPSATLTPTTAASASRLPRARTLPLPRTWTSPLTRLLRRCLLRNVSLMCGSRLVRRNPPRLPHRSR
eukprot:07542_1